MGLMGAGLLSDMGFSHASELFLLYEGVLLGAAMTIYIELSLDLCV